MVTALGNVLYLTGKQVCLHQCEEPPYRKENVKIHNKSSNDKLLHSINQTLKKAQGSSNNTVRPHEKDIVCNCCGVKKESFVFRKKKYMDGKDNANIYSFV